MSTPVDQMLTGHGHSSAGAPTRPNMEQLIEALGAKRNQRIPIGRASAGRGLGAALEQQQPPLNSIWWRPAWKNLHGCCPFTYMALLSFVSPLLTRTPLSDTDSRVEATSGSRPGVIRSAQSLARGPIPSISLFLLHACQGGLAFAFHASCVSAPAKTVPRVPAQEHSRLLDMTVLDQELRRLPGQTPAPCSPASAPRSRRRRTFCLIY